MRIFEHECHQMRRLRLLNYNIKANILNSFFHLEEESQLCASVCESGLVSSVLCRNGLCASVLVRMQELAVM